MNKVREYDWWVGKGTYKYSRNEQLEVLFDKAWNDELPEDPELYWQIVSGVWQRTEFPYLESEAWSCIFNREPGPTKHTKEWLKTPQIVYRGINNIYLDVDISWSWTTNHDKAKWFANRNCRCCEKSGKPIIKEFDCSKDISKVLYVFDDGFEDEILLWPDNDYR